MIKLSLCEILGEVSASEKFEVRCFECIFSAIELVSGIRSLFRSSLKRKKLIQNEILTSLVARFAELFSTLCCRKK